MEDLSLEVLERIVKRLDHISMCRLALMSTHMRKGVHSYCTSHLRQLAEQDSSTAASLEACGWVAGNDHDIWECSCIHLVVGPWHYWVKGTRRKEDCDGCKDICDHEGHTVKLREGDISEHIKQTGHKRCWPAGSEGEEEDKQCNIPQEIPPQMQNT